MTPPSKRARKLQLSRGAVLGAFVARPPESSFARERRV